MKNFNKNIIAVLLMATVLSGCGNSPETPAEQSSASEVETEVETETAVQDYSEAKAKIEALKAKVEDYVDPIYSEKEGDRATIIMTEYLKSGEPDSSWIFYAVDEENKVCYESYMYKNAPGKCAASPDGDTRYYACFTGTYGTYKFYVTYCSEYYDVYYYNESEPIVIDENTVIEDPTFYTDRTTSSYYFNCSDLLGDAKYEMSIARLNKQLADGEITEEEYYQKKAERLEYYKD